MGQPIVVIEKPSSNPGVVRFETNRALTGMGHERYLAGEDVWGNRPPDELARRILARGGVAGVQVNGNVVTVDLEKGHDSAGLVDIIENLYIFYPQTEGDEPASQEPAAAELADEEPAAEEPVAEAPVAEAPVAEESAAEAPVAEEPAAEEPTAEAEPEG